MLHEKQEVYNELTGQYELMEDSTGFIKDHIASDGEVPDIPMYREEAILFHESFLFYIGRDSGFYACFNAFGGYPTDMLLTAFPTTAFRQDPDGYIYAMINTDQGGRVYYFLSEAESIFLDGFPVLMKEKLSYSHFSDLSIGDSITKVGNIDPVIAVYKGIFDAGTDIALENYAKMGAPPTSIHLLTDGILKIEYKRTETDDYVITDIIYNEDFILQGLAGETCYRIADVDYIAN